MDKNKTFIVIFSFLTLILLLISLSIYEISIFESLNIELNKSQGNISHPYSNKTQFNKSKDNISRFHFNRSQFTGDEPLEVVQDRPIRLTVEFEDENLYSWGSDSWILKRKVNDSWKTIRRKNNRYFKCAGIPECNNVNTDQLGECPKADIQCELPMWYRIVQRRPRDNAIIDESEEFRWNQSYMEDNKTFSCRNYGEIIDWECVVFGQAPIGEYKILLEYARNVSKDQRHMRNISNINYLERKLIIKKECTSSGEQCEGKPNGTRCTTGVWCDKFGRKCGGRSCGGMGLGECYNGTCRLKPPGE